MFFSALFYSQIQAAGVALSACCLSVSLSVCSWSFLLRCSCDGFCISKAAAYRTVGFGTVCVCVCTHAHSFGLWESCECCDYWCLWIGI